jgi:hypothetical protein
LSDEIVPTEKVPSEKFNVHSPGVTLEEGGKVAAHGPDAGYRYVPGENVYEQGIARLNFKLESFQINNWMFIGVAKGDVVPANSHSFKWSGSYGWARGQHGQVWKEGSSTVDNALKNVTKQGDTVELVLDCDAAKLSLHLSTGQQFHIEIPKSQTWRLNVNLQDPNDRLRIMNE